MFNKIAIALLPLLFFLLLTSEYSSDDGRAGYTGSPGESDCTNCHSSFPVNTGGGSITLINSGMTGNEYVPGQTYNLSVTVARTANSLFGFAFEALTTGNDNAGTLVITDPAATQIKTRVVNSVTRRNVVHQLNAGAMSGSKTFNFSWTAPVAGTGTVGFYFAGVAADGNGNDNNDYTYKSNLAVTEQICSAPAQPADITGNDSVCPGSSQTYSILPVSGAVSYTWIVPNGWTGSSSSNTLSIVTGNLSGTLSVKAENICGTSPATFLPVLIYSSPSTNITLVNDTLFASGNGSYQWYFNSALLINDTNQYLIPLHTGDYMVSIENQFGCIAYSSVFPHTIVSTNDMYSSIDYNISPNPFQDKILVEKENNKGEAKLKVYSASGALQFESILTGNKNLFNFSFLPEGIYFLNISSDKNKFYTQKIIKN